MRHTVALVLCFLAGHLSRAASLALPGQIAVPGEILVAALSFSSQGQAVSGIQFDMDADPGLSFGRPPV